MQNRVRVRPKFPLVSCLSNLLINRENSRPVLLPYVVYKLRGLFQKAFMEEEAKKGTSVFNSHFDFENVAATWLGEPWGW